MPVRELIRTGSLDGIAVGAAEEQLREVLPEPSSWAPTDGPESGLWSCGTVDLVFRDGLEHLGREDPRTDRIEVDASFLFELPRHLVGRREIATPTRQIAPPATA